MFFQVKLARFILLSGFLFCAFCALSAGSLLERLSLALHSVPAEARVVSIDESDGEDTHLSYCYHYQVGNREFEGFSSCGSVDTQVGDSVSIYYSSAEPGLSSTMEPVPDFIFTLIGEWLLATVLSIHIIFRPHRTCRRLRWRRKI